MTCKVCDPSLDPTGPRTGEGHVAVRFDLPPRGRWNVWLNGEDVTSQTYEAIAGNSGVIYRYVRLEGRLRRCACGNREPEAERVEGEVSVSRWPPPPRRSLLPDWWYGKP